MKRLLLLITILTMTACSGGCAGFNPEAIGVDPTDNAILKVEGHVDGYFTDSSLDYCRTEFPAGLDLATLSPEQLEAATTCE